LCDLITALLTLPTFGWGIFASQFAREESAKDYLFGIMKLRSIFLSSILLILFSPIGIDIFLPAIPQMQHELSADTTAIQLSLSLFVLALGIGQLLVGPLSDRFGRRPVALTGICVYLAASLVIAAVENPIQLVIFRILQGLGASCTSIVAFTIIRDRYSPKEGARIYSYLNGTLNLIPALAPLMGGVLTVWAGWRSNFYFLALFSAVVLLIIFRSLPETRPDSTRHSQLFSFKPYLEILRNKQFTLYAICAMGAMSVVLSYAFYAPEVLMVQLGLSSIQFGLIFGANALVVMASSFVAPFIIQALGRRGSIMIGSILMLVSGFLIPLLMNHYGTSMASFMLPVAISCCGFAFILGAAASLSLEPFGDCAGTAAALQGCIQMLGASLVCILASFLPVIEIFSLAILMLIFGTFGLLIRFWLDRRELQVAPALNK
jgi:Bcr/CflA subfamily drug resistance transporter